MIRPPSLPLDPNERSDRLLKDRRQGRYKLGPRPMGSEGERTPTLPCACLDRHKLYSYRIASKGGRIPTLPYACPGYRQVYSCRIASKSGRIWTLKSRRRLRLLVSKSRRAWML